MFSVKTSVGAGTSLILAMSIHARTPIFTYAGNALVVRTSVPAVTAVCSSEWSWMNNGKSQSPCVVAAWVQATCGSSSLQWSVTALPPDNKYDAPNATTANPCTCSWSAYNLLSACTVCQDMNTIQTWGTWKTSCGEFLSDTTYFPSDKGYTLPSETAIPFWAGRNPQTWHDAIFDESEAQGIQGQGYADLTGTTNSTSAPSSKPPIGVIVGGVVGGFAVVFLAAAFCAFRLFKQRRRQEQNKYSNGAVIDTGHMRSMSDPSQRHFNRNDSGMIVHPGLPVLSQGMGGILPMSSSMQTLSHTGGQSLPSIMSTAPHMQFANVGVNMTRASPPISHGPPHGNIPSATSQFSHTVSPSLSASTYTVSSQTHHEDIIFPFLSAQTSSRPTGHKVARGTTGSPGSSHDFSEEEIPPPSSHRARMNPPAYTARVRAGEVQTVAPTPSEDVPGQRKHEYGPSIESQTWGTILEGADPGTGLATDGGSLETGTPGEGLRSGGSTEE